MSGRAPLPPKRTKASRIPKLSVQSFDYTAEDPVHGKVHPKDKGHSHKSYTYDKTHLSPSPDPKSSPVGSASDAAQEMDESLVLEGHRGGEDDPAAVIVHHAHANKPNRLGVKGAQLRAKKERDADLPVFKEPMDLQTMEADMTISNDVKLKGDMKFENLLRIDGQLTGHISAPPSAGLIIGESGSLFGNVLGLGQMLIEGKVVGNINVESLCLAETAQVFGDLAARSIDIRSGSSFVGNMHISAFEPIAVVNPLTGKIDPSRKKGQYLLTQDDVEDVKAERRRNKKKARKAQRKDEKKQRHERRVQRRLDGEEDVDSDVEEKGYRVKNGKSHHHRSADSGSSDEDNDGIIDNGGDSTDGEEDGYLYDKQGNKKGGGNRRKVSLYILDPQVDFHSGGSCAIPHADEDAERIAEFIMDNIGTIEEIFISLDSHHRMHIAHSVFWTNDKDERPSPYTSISLEDVNSGKWYPRDSVLLPHCKFYLRELSMNSKSARGYNRLPTSLIIKPEHCLIGTIGHSVVPVINDAIQEWAAQRMRKVAYIFKGTNCLVDTTSALSSDVELKEDPTTGYDPALISRLNAADQLVICGQSLCHSLCHTMKDLLMHWKGSHSKISLLKDCSSIDTNLAHNIGQAPTSASPALSMFDAERFWHDMQAAGVHITRSNELIIEISKQ